ncbi:MAG: glycoside hydrolase family 78 protein [Gemmatimonadaceae bacterium]
MRRLFASCCAVLCALPAAAQRTVTVIGPTDNPLRDGIPAFTIVGAGFTAADMPLRFTLQVGANATFASGLLTDTTVAGSGTSLTIAPRRLFPEKSVVYWRGVVTTAAGLQVNSVIAGPFITAPWLTLLSPNNPNGSVVYSNRPQFTWRSARIDASAGRWEYEIRITASNGTTVLVGRLDDTVYIPVRDLEGNTSYRWSVSAWTAAGDSTHVSSTASFVVLDPSVPPATILFQNFPNPFPNERVNATCIWFDLRSASSVDLQVLDLRGNHVRSLIPSSALSSASFAPGRYGRASEGSNSGCDARFSWDGTDDSGRTVPTGVYLIRLRADGVEAFRKALFKGR